MYDVLYPPQYALDILCDTESVHTVYLRMVYFLHDRTKRSEEQQTQNKVADAVDDVIRYPCDPPCQCHTPSAYEQIRDRTEQAEKQPEKCRQYTIKDISDLVFIGIEYKHYQQRPYVQIHK